MIFTKPTLIYKRFFSPQRQLYRQFKQLLGFTPYNITVYQQALRHSSVAETSLQNNERLEYLGDAILDAIIGAYLFKKFPKQGEGFLTEMRAKIVNRHRLGSIAQSLELKKYLQYNKDSMHANRNVLGNTLEALIGAIYLDKGYHVTYHFVINKIVSAHIDVNKLPYEDINYKSKLLEWGQKYNYNISFSVKEMELSDNEKSFIATVLLNEKVVASGQGMTKKSAQKNAAQKVYEQYNIGEER
ncbi:MAG: ribonuclease III [Chitinophagales bacterium]|nr:ribonuclease III [Bacteroidota bacterium]MCB9042376.1 ribonuclease III [Chitinophagales bacterium]